MKDVSNVGLNNLKIVQKWQAGAMSNICSRVKGTPGKDCQT